MSERKAVWLDEVLDAVGALYVAAKYPQDRENNATVDAAIVAVRALPADPYAAAAIRLAEAGIACDDMQMTSPDDDEFSAWLNKYDGACERYRDALAAFRAAREARK